MNREHYMKVLEKLFPWMERLGAMKFLQDGAHCHTSKKVMVLLKKLAKSKDLLGTGPTRNRKWNPL
jgi:hypothetical protein